MLAASDLATLLALIEDQVARIPRPVDGRDGIDGSDGVDGADGKDGRDGKNGRDGVDGRNGKDGRDGRDGIDGDRGSDGRGIASAKVNDAFHLIVTLTDGTQIDAGYVRGEMGGGVRGQSAYEVARANGFQGTVTEWLASLGGTGGGDTAQRIDGGRPGDSYVGGLVVSGGVPGE